jgi:fumarylpyruvate hydrolase
MRSPAPGSDPPVFEVAQVTVPVAGSASPFPVRRIYCVGKNYADHVAEMGGNPKSSPPIFFSKPASAVALSGSAIPYPSRTQNLHHEIELVVAMQSGGPDIDARDALGHVFGYAVGNDLTRRDLQNNAKKTGSPWDMAKGFDHSAVMSPIIRVSECGHPATGRIWLAVNGTVRQDASLAAMIWSVPEIIAELSSYVRLEAGDLIYTGTPAGVGPLVRGDAVTGGVDGVGALTHSII